MATYTIPINSLFTESGDDVYAKPLDGNFSGSNWPDDSVAAIEVSDTNVYEITLDETKGYVLYLNGHSQSFTANAGTDVITANSHGLTDGATLRFKGGDLPAPLAQSTIYYLRDVTTHTFKVAATAGGAATDITDAGSGTMTFTAPSKRSKAGDTKIGTVPAIRASQLTAEGEFDTKLDAIKAKTDLIGTVSSGINRNGSYVDAGAVIIRLTRNDAYDNTANPAKTFTVTKDYTSGWTGTFTIRHKATGVTLLSKSVTVTSATILTVSLVSTDTDFSELTSDEDFGPHPFDIEMVSGSSKQTAVTGIAIITKDQTYS